MSVQVNSPKLDRLYSLNERRCNDDPCSEVTCKQIHVEWDLPSCDSGGHHREECDDGGQGQYDEDRRYSSTQLAVVLVRGREMVDVAHDSCWVCSIEVDVGAVAETIVGGHCYSEASTVALASVGVRRRSLYFRQVCFVILSRDPGLSDILLMYK